MKNLSFIEIKNLLDEKYDKFNRSFYIETDPIQIPHSFKNREDIEISAFMSASIAWGNRVSIVKNAKRLMQLMGNSPYDFVINHSKNDLKPILDFVHRTFNGQDCAFFIESLKNIYLNHGRLKQVFVESYNVWLS